MQKFCFNHQPDALTPALTEVTTYLRQQNWINDDWLFKAKYIILEMLTNALKHSSASESFLIISKQDDGLQLTKADAGKPLFSISGILNGNEVHIRQDAACRLYGIVQPDNKLLFRCDNETSEIEVEGVSEHFGFQIITRLADKFTYHYQNPNNIFIVNLYEADARGIDADSF